MEIAPLYFQISIHHTRSEVFTAVTIYVVVLLMANILDKHTDPILMTKVSLRCWCTVSLLKREEKIIDGVKTSEFNINARMFLSYVSVSVSGVDGMSVLNV